MEDQEIKNQLVSIINILNAELTRPILNQYILKTVGEELIKLSK
jgi:hypothetical protein